MVAIGKKNAKRARKVVLILQKLNLFKNIKSLKIKRIKKKLNHPLNNLECLKWPFCELCI